MARLCWSNSFIKTGFSFRIVEQVAAGQWRGKFVIDQILASSDVDHTGGCDCI